MTEFGEILRALRKECIDPDNPGQRLSQVRLGELLGRELDIRGGYTGAAVSDWERGKSKIHADQRLVLVGLLKILYELGAIKSSSEANEFLAAGNYRALDQNELLQIAFKEPPKPHSEAPTAEPNTLPPVLQFLSGRLFSESSPDELQTWLAAAKEGPAPFWPRTVVALLRRFLDRWSALRMIPVLVWLAIWLLTWQVITPSLRWPFASREKALGAMVLYSGGSLIIPLLIGTLTETKHDIFWKAHNLANTPAIRLYTHQGASVGFHLGYFGIFALYLFRYYVDLKTTTWIEVIVAGIVVILGYIGARLVPYNVWRGFGRLDLADGAVFFIFVILGPLWGYYFFEFYTLFLDSFVGALTLLSVVIVSILAAAWRQYRSSTT